MALTGWGGAHLPLSAPYSPPTALFLDFLIRHTMKNSLPIFVLSLLIFGAWGCGKEKAAFEEAAFLNTDRAYQAFLAQFPEGKYAEQVHFVLASRRGEPLRIQAFLAANPNGEYAARAQAMLDSLGQMHGSCLVEADEVPVDSAFYAEMMGLLATGRNEHKVLELLFTHLAEDSSRRDQHRHFNQSVLDSVGRRASINNFDSFQQQLDSLKWIFNSRDRKYQFEMALLNKSDLHALFNLYENNLKEMANLVALPGKIRRAVMFGMDHWEARNLIGEVIAYSKYLKEQRIAIEWELSSTVRSILGDLELVNLDICTRRVNWEILNEYFSKMGYMDDVPSFAAKAGDLNTMENHLLLQPTIDSIQNRVSHLQIGIAEKVAEELPEADSSELLNFFLLSGGTNNPYIFDTLLAVKGLKNSHWIDSLSLAPFLLQTGYQNMLSRILEVKTNRRNIEEECFAGDTLLVDSLYAEENSQDSMAFPLLMIAIAAQNPDMLDYLLRKGEDPNQVVKNGYATFYEEAGLYRAPTALVQATYLGNKHLMKILLDHGADVNLCDSAGYAPLMVAALRGDASLARYLISRGASLSDTTHDGRTPLDLARQNGHLAFEERVVGTGKPGK